MQTLRESSTTSDSGTEPVADGARAGGGAARVRTAAKAAGACAAGLATAGALLLAPAAVAADGDKIQKNTVDPQYSVTIAAQFARPNAQMLSSALTYDPKLVPVGSHVTVSERTDSKQTRVGLRVADLPANRTYGAHVHTGACGVRPTDAGGHYQHRKDPRTPSVDPAYANPKNEVWLDFTTNANGEGSAESRHAWNFRPGEARSVAIHERRTATGPGVAGTAGRVVACYTVPFNNSKEAGKAVAGVLKKTF